MEVTATEIFRRQWFGGSVFVATLLAGVYTVYSGHEVAGSLFGISGLTGIVTKFILGRASAARRQTVSPVANDGKARQ